MSAIGPTDHMRNHWWWRPGWHLGRSFYTWHVVFDNQPQLHDLAKIYQTALAPLPGLDLIPLRWLHLTMQGIAFTDEVSQQDITDIVNAAHKHLANQRPISLTVGPALVDPEAIMFELTPPAALNPVRTAIREAIADVWGAARVPEAEQWSPHISIAYSNSDAPASPYLAALNTVTRPPVQLTVPGVHLIKLNRDNRLYQWITEADVPFAG